MRNKNGDIYHSAYLKTCYTRIEKEERKKENKER